MKTCTECGGMKPLNEFPRDSRQGTEGRRSKCTHCATSYRLEWEKRNPDKIKATKRRTWLKTKYGITPDQFDAILAAQGGLCAICGTDKPGGVNGVFAVDHDHTTGMIRGLLCYSCNLGLGKLGDTIASVSNALEYLQREERWWEDREDL